MRAKPSEDRSLTFPSTILPIATRTISFLTADEIAELYQAVYSENQNQNLIFGDHFLNQAIKQPTEINKKLLLKILIKNAKYANLSLFNDFYEKIQLFVNRKILKNKFDTRDLREITLASPCLKETDADICLRALQKKLEEFYKEVEQNAKNEIESALSDYSSHSVYLLRGLCQTINAVILHCNDSIEKVESHVRDLLEFENNAIHPKLRSILAISILKLTPYIRNNTLLLKCFRIIILQDLNLESVTTGHATQLVKKLDPNVVVTESITLLQEMIRLFENLDLIASSASPILARGSQDLDWKNLSRIAIKNICIVLNILAQTITNVQKIEEIVPVLIELEKKVSVYLPSYNLDFLHNAIIIFSSKLSLDSHLHLIELIIQEVILRKIDPNLSEIELKEQCNSIIDAFTNTPADPNKFFNWIVSLLKALCSSQVSTFTKDHFISILQSRLTDPNALTLIYELLNEIESSSNEILGVLHHAIKLLTEKVKREPGLLDLFIQKLMLLTPSSSYLTISGYIDCIVIITAHSTYLMKRVLEQLLELLEKNKSETNQYVATILNLIEKFSQKTNDKQLLEFMFDRALSFSDCTRNICIKESVLAILIEKVRNLHSLNRVYEKYLAEAKNPTAKLSSYRNFEAIVLKTENNPLTPLYALLMRLNHIIRNNQHRKYDEVRDICNSIFVISKKIADPAVFNRLLISLRVLYELAAQRFDPSLYLNFRIQDFIFKLLSDFGHPPISLHDSDKRTVHIRNSVKQIEGYYKDCAQTPPTIFHNVTDEEQKEIARVTIEAFNQCVFSEQENRCVSTITVQLLRLLVIMPSITNHISKTNNGTLVSDILEFFVFLAQHLTAHLPMMPVPYSSAIQVVMDRRIAELNKLFLEYQLSSTLESDVHTETKFKEAFESLVQTLVVEKYSRTHLFHAFPRRDPSKPSQTQFDAKMFDALLKYFEEHTSIPLQQALTNLYPTTFTDPNRFVETFKNWALTIANRARSANNLSRYDVKKDSTNARCIL